MLDVFTKASALRSRLNTAEELLRKQREVADEITKQLHQAVNRAGAAEAKLKDVERELEAARETITELRGQVTEAEQAHDAKNAELEALTAKLGAKDDELKVLADVQARAEGWEQVCRDLSRTIREVAEAAGVGPNDDLVDVVRTHKSALERLETILGDIKEELRDAAGAPTADGDAGLQAADETISVGDAPPPAEAFQPVEAEARA